ncbi:serine-rich adhesin for platelets [Monomorium pharaonis]|uniref:serine-rich adhesin for platelets n=1 Tax=Monomorium pharaonis TaxID=307658 RepID=UPI00063F7540|nr:serine-rich adhesin for platelets [Monomorium pharaonis]
MCEQTEINYLDGDVVWVKLGACWWPGQVIGLNNLPEDVQTEFQKKPLIAAVKFFQEDTYEFVKNYQQIYKYNCTLKDEFIKKGMDKYRTKSKDGSNYMDKFPGDVEMAEKLTGGNPNILHQEKFCPEEKPDISALFGEKKIPKKKRDREEGHRRSDGTNIAKRITHPRFLRGESDHEVRIRQQPNSLPSTPTSAGSPVYRCHFCNFTSSRVNVIICHIKSHRSSDDSPSSLSKVKTYSQSRGRSSNTSTPKRKYVRKDKSQSSKKKTENRSESVKRRQRQTEKSSKKKKSDPELREKLLADWDDESDEEANVDINSSLNSRLSDSPVKNLSSADDSKYSEKNNVVESAENNEIIMETEKLLKETEQLSSIHMIRDSLDSLHASTNIQFSFDKKSDFENSRKDIKTSDKSNETLSKSPKKDTSGSESSESKNASEDKDDKKSRLACFDFDEDDLSEPSIPPVRKIPRVFGEKNLSLKKEIIKEFEMSQALKNEIKREVSDKVSELSKNMELKADEIMEIIQGRDNQEEKDADASEKLDESEVQGKIKPKHFGEDKKENKTMQSDDSKQKSNTCETVEIVEIFEIEKGDGHSSNAAKNIKAKFTTASNINKEVSEKKDETDIDSSDEKLPQSERIDSEDAIAESNDNASMKEADDTLSERFTTETEDETVSESAETMPEQSENSDTDMLDQSVESLSGNIGQTPVKRGRGRPRKNARSPGKSISANQSPQTKTNRGNKRIRLSERIEVERKTSDSDTDRSYSGRRRKPNKKYLESDIYVQDTDYKAFRTDESQSESETKISERATTKSRRGRRSKGANKRSNEVVAQMDKQEIEVSDQTPTVAENNVSILSMDVKNKESINKIETFSEVEEPSEMKHDEKQTKSLSETATAKIDLDVSSENVEMTTSVKEAIDKKEIKEIEPNVDKTMKKTSEIETKEDISKQNEDTEDLKDYVKPLIIEQTENTTDKIEVQDTLKTNVDMLPPKKSQIKKFELSQIDFLDVEIQANKRVEAESKPESQLDPESQSQAQPQPECKIKSEPTIELQIKSQLKSRNDTDEKVNKEGEIKATINKAMNKSGIFLNAEKHEQPSFKFEKKVLDVKVQETQSTEEVLQKSHEVNQLKSKSPEKSPKTDDVGNAPKSPTKSLIEQQLTPKKSPMQTRYKGRFTPETGKGKKDKDLFLEERPANTFQEAFLKTLQMDKKKIVVENVEVSSKKNIVVENVEVSAKGKKEKRIIKRKADEIESNIAAMSQNKKIGNSNNDLVVAKNIETAESISIIDNLGNIEVVVEEKVESDTKIKDNVLETGNELGSSSSELITSPLLQSETFAISENNIKKLDEIPKTTIATSSLSSDISVPVKKREMPRIIENVALTEPMQILKTKVFDKTLHKGVKHKLEVDAAKKSDQKSGPKAKIIKIETLPSNSKVKPTVKSSSHMSLTKKLQVLKTEETDALLEAQNKEQGVATSQTIVAAPVTEKYVQQSTQSLADMELDINSMPFVLSEDVLTPESIEQMPVVISSIIPASSSIPATLSFTPTTQIVSPTQQGQFKIATETTATETSPTKKKSGVPTILKTKSKPKPTVTSVKPLVPPLTGGVKGLKFQSAQPSGKTPAILTQKGTAPGKYVVVQTAGGQQLRYSVQGKAGTQQKIAIPTSGKVAGNAQVIQQGGKVVILTSGQSCQTKMVPLNISKSLGGKVQRIVTSKAQLLCPISPQGNIIATKTIIAPKADTAGTTGSPTTSKLATSSHKIINTQGIITSKGVLTPISGTIGKTALLGTLSQGIITKDGIYTPISASALSGKTIISSKALVTKSGTTLLTPQAQSLSGTKAILTPVSQAITGKTILGTQAVVGTNKGTILTPITGQQVKAIAAKSSPVKGGKVQYQLQQKVQLPILQKSPKVPISAAGSQIRAASAKAPGSTGLILQNAASPGAVSSQKSTSHSKKIVKQMMVQTPDTSTIQGVASPSGSAQQQTVTMMQQVQQPKGKAAASPTVQKVIVPRGGSRQTKAQQKIIVQKVQEPTASVAQSTQTNKRIVVATTTATATTTIATTIVSTPIAKTVAQSKQTTATISKSSVKSQVSSKAQKNLNVTMNSASTATTMSNVNVATASTTLSSLEPIAQKKAKTDTSQKEQDKTEKLQTEKSDAEKVEEPKVAAQPQIMALPTESSDGTQTYVLVTIDEQGQIQPLDNNTLMSLEGTTQNPDGTRTLYIDPSSLGEAGTLDNIVLQFDNSVMPSIQTEAGQTAIVTESFPASEVIQTGSNQDILAAALANTDFQQEINLPENQAGSVMTQTGLTQTSLINQTILQSTIIPPTEPISSPSVLETSLTLNQPIMTPLEVPSNLPIQSTDSTATSVVSTIPSSLELPITITNPSISYISATGETQIQIPGNSMPDIGEIIESPVTVARGEIARSEISANTQYVVIPNIEDNIAVAETQNVVQGAEITIAPSTTYTVTLPNSIVLEESSQVQTTPSMPIIDDTYVAEQTTFVDVPVSEMLVSKAPENTCSQQDITVTSEMIVSSHPVSSQKSITSTDNKNLDKEQQPATLQEVYSSQEIPNTSEELILQQSANEDTASSTMEITQETESENKKSATSMTVDETALITSEFNSQKRKSECKAASESHEANATDKLKRLTVSEESSDKAKSTDQQVADTLNSSKDAPMELDEAVEPDLFVRNKRSAEDCQTDEPSSQEESDRRRLRRSMELHSFEDEEEEETAIAEASQEAPSQSQYERFNVSVSSDSTDLPSQSASKLESSSAGEATQSMAYEPMETDEETVVAEPPSQSFEHTKINEASQSYETSAESNVNAPTQSFNEIAQSQERPSADEAIDDQSFPTQSYEVDKGESITENLETDAEISQEGNIPSQSNDVGADGIGTSSVSTNNSGLNEDETASSSYVPETPENQERDQDQESAISTSSYEIPPCEELNIASSSVIPDTSVSEEHAGEIHDNGVPEIPTSSSYNLNPDITSTHHVDSVPTSSYEDQVIVEQNVSTSYEVPIPMTGLEETCSQNFVTESGDHHRNEPSSYYPRHQEVTASYYESVDQDANSRLGEGEDPHEEHVTPGGYYEGNPQEVSQSYFAPTGEETANYSSHGISPSYYDPSRPESEASQSYYSTDDLDGKSTEQTASSPSTIEASQSFYQERSSELRLRQQGEATPTYPEGYPVDYTLENSPIERHDLVESSVPATRPMDR